MKRQIVALLIAGVGLAGCLSVGTDADPGSPAADTAAAGLSRTSDSSISIAPPSDPSRPPESIIESTVATTTTTEVAETVDIAKTIALVSDGAVVLDLLPDRDDPSPLDGDAVPPRPDARCAVGTGVAALGRYEIVGCEFDSDVAAGEYMNRWLDAIAIPNPTWRDETMTSWPIDQLPSWSGRSIEDEVSAEHSRRSVARADLVQQRGRRVYVVTATEPADDRKIAALRVVEVAEAQQAHLDSLGIDDRTGAGEVDPGHLSIRGATPTWEELNAVAPNLAGTPQESDSLDGIFGEYYARTLTSSDTDDGENFRVEVEREDDAGRASDSLLHHAGRSCLQLAAPLAGVENGIRCATDDGVFFGTYNGPFLLTMEVPTVVDDGSVQELFVKWDRWFRDLPLPVDAEPPTKDLAPRTDSPLPTDGFPLDGYDGSYDRSRVSDESAVAIYVRRSEASDAPSDDDYYQVSVAPADTDLRDEIFRGYLVSDPDDLTSDHWTTMIWESTYTEGDEFKKFETSMIRVLPSGDLLEVKGERIRLPAEVEAPDPPFEADGPLLTSTWEWFQDYSLAEYPPDPDAVIAVRSDAFGVATTAEFNPSVNTIIPFNGGVAPDSPPGTIAEWRVIWPGSAAGTRPETIRRVIAFDDAAAATNFTTAITSGLTMTPIEGVAEVDGRFNAAAGLIVMQRGKWVVINSSPGRTDWSSTIMINDTSIEHAGYYFAQHFANSGLI